MSIVIPGDAPASVQRAFRDVSAAIDRLTRHGLDLHGQRIIGAADAVAGDHYVTLRQLREEIGAPEAPSTASSLPEEFWERIGTTGVSFEYLRPRVVDNRLLIGATNINAIVNAGALAISIDSTNTQNITMEGYSSDASGTSILGWKGRGTRTSPTGVVADDILLRILGQGLIDTGALGSGSSGVVIKMAASQTWTSTAQGAYLTFRVTKNGTTTVYDAVKITSEGSVLLAVAGALATGATDGFTYLPTCAGKPTGTPTAQTGMVPIVYDSTNNRLGFYNSGWKFVGPTPPSCRAYHSANQSLTTATLTALALDSERFDTDTMHSTVTNNSRITFTSAGRYLIGGCARYEANTTGDRALFVRVNGTDYIVSSRVDAAATASAPTDLNVSTYYTFAANDYAELIGYQASGGGLNVTASVNFSPEFWAVKVSE